MALITILFVTAAASFSLPTRRPTSGANFYPIANSSMSASRKTAPASRSILSRARRPTPRLARWSGKVLVARFAGGCDARWRRSWPFSPRRFLAMVAQPFIVASVWVRPSIGGTRPTSCRFSQIAKDQPS
jgi:hypothetical protein